MMQQFMHGWKPMDSIIIDNFLEEELFYTLKNISYSDNIKWGTQVSNRSLSECTSFDMGEMIYEKDNLVQLKNNEIIYNIFQKIITHIEVKAEGLFLGRAYFNRQKSTIDGCLHQDDGQYTALLYVSDYEKEWGGFTQLWHSDSKQEYILPIPNRLVIFDALTYHKGFGFSHVWNPERISLAFKINNIMNLAKAAFQNI